MNINDLGFLDISLFWLLAAFAGGLFGAAIGANFGFVMTGFTALIGMAVLASGGGTFVLDYVAFGPFTGPHVAFAGGVAAAAFAAKKGYQDTGREVSLPLARLGQPSVLLVGACFGAGGYVVQKIVMHIPWFGTHTDSVAFTVVLSAIVARLAFGRLTLIDAARFTEGTGLLSRIRPTKDSFWIRYQEKPIQFLTIGLFFGMLAGGAALILQDNFPAIAEAGNAQVFPFAISAVTILFLILGMEMPVTHHMTITGGLAAVTFLPIVGGSATAALIIGGLGGILGASVGELASRLFHIRSNTHFDPPAAAIWLCNTIVVSLAAILS